METYRTEKLLEAIQEQLLAKVGECSCERCPAFEMISNALETLRDNSRSSIAMDLGLISNQRCPLRDED